MNKDTKQYQQLQQRKLLTRLPMKRGERPTVSTYIGLIILFLSNGIITPNSLQLSSSSFCLVVAKVNAKKRLCFWVVSKKFIFLLTFIKIATSIFMKNLKMQLSNFRFWGVGLPNPATQTNFVCLVCQTLKQYLEQRRRGKEI